MSVKKKKSKFLNIFLRSIEDRYFITLYIAFYSKKKNNNKKLVISVLY